MRREDSRPLHRDADRIVVAGVGALIVLLTVLLHLPGANRLHREFDATLVETDFRAFYCGSLTTRQHADPYLAAPLERCENSVALTTGAASGSAPIIDPAPLPAYDFALLWPISLLSFYPAGPVERIPRVGLVARLPAARADGEPTRICAARRFLDHRILSQPLLRPAPADRDRRAVHLRIVPAA